MSLKFVLRAGNLEKEVSSEQILREYGQITGLQPVGLSQDGASGIYQTANGIQTIPFHEAFQDMGIEIGSYEPTNSIQAENLGKYRMAMETIQDPDIQQAYLKTVAQKDFGIDNPQIVNQGSKAFLWNPNQGAWVALTDSPGLDRGDVMSGAASVGRGALSVAGGALGAAGGLAATAPTGPLAIAGAAGGAGLGSAIGSALGDEAQAGIMAGLDPNFRDAYGSASNYAQKEGGNIGRNALVSGVTGGLMSGIGKALPGLSSLRPSNIVQGAGKMTEGAGKMTSAIGRGLDNDIGRMGMQMGLDPTGISGVGALGGFAKDMAPKAAQGAAKGMQFVRDSVAKMRDFTGPLRPMAGETFEQTAKNMPGLGGFTRGLESLGGGLEKIGRGAENAIIGTTKGVGAGLQGTGRLAQLGGKGMQYLEKPALQAGAQNMTERPQFGMQGANQPQMYQTGLDPYQNNQGFQVMNQTPGLFDAIAARGGFNVL